MELASYVATSQHRAFQHCGLKPGDFQSNAFLRLPPSDEHRLLRTRLPHMWSSSSSSSNNTTTTVSAPLIFTLESPSLLV